ncbi:MAG TPA: hypothetical protein VFV87_13795 [Pirellulaceae bacterium]|nr:hypothetical protein [Pirellulaceae bacterium]
MGGWRNILNLWNPTRKWRSDPSRLLVLDLDQHQLCGVGIGDSVATLAFLGPATGWSGRLQFPNHGLAIVEEGTVAELHFFFGHTGEPAGGTFRGEIRHLGAAIPPLTSHTENDIVGRFGPPYWRDADGSETILFYEFPQREWQWEFGLDGRLKCLVIGLPILADQAQRDAYQVTRPWPPWS